MARLGGMWRWLPLMLGIALVFCAPARGASFVVLEGPLAGLTVDAETDGAVPNFAGTKGKVEPQADGCNYRFEGTNFGVAVSGCAAPKETLTPAYTDLSKAIVYEHHAVLALENRGVLGANGPKAALGLLTDGVKALDAWQEAIDVETTGSIHDQLLDKQQEAASSDAVATAKLEEAKAASGSERAELIEQAKFILVSALQTKREGLAIEVADVPMDGLLPTGPGSLPAPEDLGQGTATDLLDPDHIVGNHTTPTTVAWFVGLGTGAEELPGDTPSFANGFGPNGTIMGQSAGSPGIWPADRENGGFLTFQEIFGGTGNVYDANDFGGVGFRIQGGDELATAFEENFKGEKPGIKLRTINAPGNGGASLFTVNEQNVMYGDRFLNGSSGPFEAFRVDPNGEVSRLWRPDDGSTQPLGSNDFLAVGGASHPGSFEAAYFLGDEHFTPHTGFGQNTLIYSINDAGVGVGQTGSSPNTDAALFANGSVYSLDSLIPGGSGWDLKVANEIDEDGNIVGTGTFGGQDKAFLIRGGNTVVNDLQLMKSVQGGTGPQDNKFKVGKQQVHFIVKLTNHGPHQAKEVSVVDHIPKHCKFDRVKVDPHKLGKQATVTNPDKGEDGGDVKVTLPTLDAGKTLTIHIFCNPDVQNQETFTNKSEVSTHAGQVEPGSDPHPNSPNADYILKP